MPALPTRKAVSNWGAKALTAPTSAPVNESTAARMAIADSRGRPPADCSIRRAARTVMAGSVVNRFLELAGDGSGEFSGLYMPTEPIQQSAKNR